VAITIDKVMHVLSMNSTSNPPIKPLDPESLFSKLWSERGCVKENLREVLHHIEDQPFKALINSAFNLILKAEQSCDSLDSAQILSEQLHLQKLQVVRDCFEDVSRTLRQVNSKTVKVPPLCDMLLIYARTETFFTNNDELLKTKGERIDIRQCDVRHKDGSSMDKET
jgi:hypothetical protein